MKTCPSCNAKLTDEELQAGHCEVCGSDFEPRSVAPSADPPASTQNYMQTVDASALPIDLDSDSLDLDSLPDVAPDNESARTLDSSSPAERKPTGAQNYMQTVDASALPIDLDSDAIDFDSPPEEGSKGKNSALTIDASAPTDEPPTGGKHYMQTVDTSALPIDLDSDSLDFDSLPASDDNKRSNPTISAGDVSATLDSDSIDADIPTVAPNPPVARAYTQTVEAVDLPESVDTDSIDMDSGSPPTERAYTQTIDSSNLPIEQDTDSVDANSFEKSDPPARPAYNQTIDASQLPLGDESDSINFVEGTSAPKDVGIGRTVDSSFIKFDQDTDSIDGVKSGEGSTDATIDSTSLPTGGVKPGTVSDVRGAQTIDSDAGSVDLPNKDGTVNERKYMATVDSADITGGDSGTMAERQYAATYDSSVVGDDPKALNDMWAGDQNAGATPRMTIKGREEPPKSSSQSLVVQRRAFREVTEEHTFGGDADYDLVKKLGEGGMGVVYAGRQASIDRTVAIKMLKPHMSADQGQRNKFLAEAVITGDLDHPNIVPIYDLGANDEGALFYAMKCVKGTPWDDCISKKSLNENIEILLKACDAVAFGHSRGIIHRDLKPENTMLGGFGEVLVMDWGLALPFGKQFEKSRSITPSASMGGTPAYMAPEMATGPFDKMGPASDIYLLGAILYEIVTGAPPHRGKDVMKCLFAAAKNEIVPTEKKGELVDIALKAMATKVEDRYETVQDFQAAIRGYIDHSESISMSTRATDDLEAAQNTDRYEDYSRAVFGFEEAYELWDGNKRALEGVMLAKLAYATSALKKGDFDLGISLLDRDIPEHAALATEIDEAKQEREARHQRAQQLKRVVVGMAAVGFISAIVVSAIMYSLKTEADNQRVIAQAAAVEAKRQEGIAIEEKAEALRQEEIAKKERAEALRQEEIAKAERAEAERQEMIANMQREEAEKQEAIAKTERDKAQIAQAEAVKQEGIARDEKNKAEYEAYVALIGLAAAKIDENAFGRARELLTSCKPELRNWEWGRLMHICSQSVHDYDVGAPVDAVAFAPDGKRFITGGWNGSARVWNSDDGSSIDLPLEGLYVQSVAFSPIANQVATGCDDKSAFLRIWDLETQRPVRTLQGHEDAVTSISYSRDGKRLLTTSFDNTARIWDVETGKQLQVLAGHSWWVWDAAFSADESKVVTASQDGTAIVWTLADGTKSPAFAGHQGPVYSVAFSPDGEHIVSGGYDKRVLLWKAADLVPFDFSGLLSDQEVPPPKFLALDDHTAAVRSVQFSSDGKLVLSAGHDNTVKVWSVESASPLKTLRGHDSWVRACAFSPDGQWVLSAGYDNHARMWNVEGYEEVRVLRGRVLEGHLDAIMAVSFSRDGHQIATASRDRTAKSWNAETGAELVSFREGHLFLASDSAFFSDNKQLVTSAVDNTVRVWDVASGVEVRRLEQTGRAAAVAVSKDNRWVATGSDRRTAKLWNAETGDLVHELDGHKVEVTAVAFSPDDRILYTGDSNGRGVLWNRETGEQLRRLDWHTSKVAAARFTPDGTRLLTASDDKNVCQWDVSKIATDPETVAPIIPLLLKHPDSVISLDLSADGTRALTACIDGNLRAWDVATAALVRTFNSVSSPVSTAALSRDGRLAVSVHAEERLVRVWNVETGTALPSGDNAGSDAFLDFNKLGGLVWSARFSNDGNSLLTVGGNEARLWDMRREIPGSHGREIMTFSPHAAVASANFSPDGQRVVTASWDNSARIWNAETGAAELKLIGGHSGYVNSAIFSPKGEYVLTSSDDRTAKLWDAKMGTVVRSYEGHTGRVRFATFSADGSKVLTASDDKTARVWNTETAELLRELVGHEWAVLSAAFSADGRSIITGSDDNSARVWNAETGELLRILAGHTAPVTSVAFSPDGKRALTASEDFTAKLWDAETAKEILNLRGHSQEVTSATFSDDGRFALTGSRDGTAILWLTEQWMQPVQGE
ncbi:MAG: protein kinase [Planctomycetaceae bacterium]|nr:protein kinase [Planctomycetaceae bacterium]